MADAQIANWRLPIADCTPNPKRQRGAIGPVARAPGSDRQTTIDNQHLS